MIRSLSLLVVVLFSSLTYAQNLYKWVEPDGSITFSTNPPKAGTAYEKVIRDNSVKSVTPSPKAVSKKPTTLSNDARSTQSTIENLNVTSSQARVQQSNTVQGGVQTPPNLAIQSQQSENASPRLDAMQATKMNHCQDLKKRVVSLERRLRSRLTPEDMDNTVIHMARYQRSFDQHCLQ